MISGWKYANKKVRLYIRIERIRKKASFFPVNMTKMYSMPRASQIAAPLLIPSLKQNITGNTNIMIINPKRMDARLYLRYLKVANKLAAIARSSTRSIGSNIPVTSITKTISVIPTMVAIPPTKMIVLSIRSRSSQSFPDIDCSNFLHMHYFSLSATLFHLTIVSTAEI